MSRARLGYRPFEELAALRSQFAKSATVYIRGNTNEAETAEPTMFRSESAHHAVSVEVPTVITEDLPGRWIEEMLFNKGTGGRVWSELDALRAAEATNPPRSPHPIRLREYGRIQRIDNAPKDAHTPRRAA
jgi:hypothetical protein